MTFEAELKALLEKYSKENISDTHSEIIAKYLCRTLDIFNVTVNRRDSLLKAEETIHDRYGNEL